MNGNLTMASSPPPVMHYSDGDSLEMWWINPWEEDDDFAPNYDDVFDDWGFE